MGRKFEFDYIIIGAGPAGISAGIELTKRKKTVLIIDENKPGGSFANTRDIPYSVGLDFAHLYDKARKESLGINLRANLPTVVAKERAASRLENDRLSEKLKSSGVGFVKGFAYLANKNTVVVGEKRFTAEKIILATGAELNPGVIQGLETVNYFSPSSALQIWRVPESLVVIGGGASGVEIAEYFAELGASVMIIEKQPRLLPTEEKEVGLALANYLKSELGVTVLTGIRVVALEQDSLGRATIFQTPEGEKMVRSEIIVLATGSRPALGNFGVENTGVKLKRDGSLAVSRDFETSEKNIFAIGDVISSSSSSTDLAAYQGRILALNQTERTKPVANYHGFIRIVKTQPEIATVGATEDDLKKSKRKYKSALVPLNETAYGATSGETGFIKLISGTKNQLLGATIMAPGASALIQEIAFAIRYGLGPLELAAAPHVKTEFSEAIRIAARQLIKK